MRRTIFVWNKVVVFVAVFSVVAVVTAAVELTPGVPSIFSAAESAFQAQTHFLVFTGSDASGETAVSSTSYYKAIDPLGSKRSFPQWLKNAGFIDDVNHWHPTGPQIIACDLGPQNGCDIPAHNPDGSLNYGPGDNVVNTDSHAIVLNAADLGFVRNQFIRCVPSCTAAKPIVYTYLENYPVNPFAASGAGGSGFPALTGYPGTNEAAAAMKSALNRPLGSLPGCADSETDTILGCSIQRIADVAFEWAPPESSPTSSTRIGTLYAFIFSADGSGTGDATHTRETISIPPAGFNPQLVSTGPTDLVHVTPNLATHVLNPINPGDPFPPNLDFQGFKEHPGVCLVCHGGSPRSTYTAGGKIDGFRFLPLDLRNLLFTSDIGGEQPATNGSAAYTDRLHQEAQIKEYNQAVLLTVPSGMQTDEQGTKRLVHLREVVQGWYAGGSVIQDTEFIPAGWREPSHGGTAPAGAEKLYTSVLAPTCRSCHFNRELKLDFGTVKGFDSYRSDILEYVLQPLCLQNHPKRGGRPMPLAHLTYQRFWQANNAAGQSLPYPAPALNISQVGDQVADHFGYGGTAGYCATIQ